MAEAYFNRYVGAGAHAVSAGTCPAGSINPQVVRVMAEEGINISRNRPKLLTPELLSSADRVIGMGCGVLDACPARGIQMDDWGISDPAGKELVEIRAIRDEIRSRVKGLLVDMAIVKDS